MQTQHTSLLYGRSELELQFPSQANVDIIRKRAMPIVEDAQQAVADALDAPVACPSISEIASDAKSACIVVCDITRPVPNGLFLRPLIERLMQSGIAKQNITVLIATGLHRPNLGDELREVIGDDWVIENVEVLNHFAEDESSLVDLGETPKRKTPVFINRRFVEADVRIVSGLVEPHFMAGYSGGRKVISPGIAGHQTIRTFHNARFMGDPLVTSCNLQNNALHEEQLAIVEKVGGALAVNTVIDEHRSLAMINFGEILASHAEAVAFVRGYAEVTCDHVYDLIVTSAAGYPLDKTYYQTVKGMVTPIEVLAPGGDLLILSACEEGMGSPHFVQAQRQFVSLGPDAFLAALQRKSLADVDEWQTQMMLRPMKIGQIHLYSDGLNEQDAAITGVQPCLDPQAFVDAYLRGRPDARVGVIPEGPYVVPMLGASAKHQMV